MAEEIITNNTDSTERKTASYKLTQEVIDKINNLAGTLGDKQTVFNALLSAYEYQRVKDNNLEVSGIMDNIAQYTSLIYSCCEQLVTDASRVREKTQNEYTALLHSKDEIIMELQKTIKEKENSYNANLEELEQLKSLINKLHANIDEMKQRDSDLESKLKKEKEDHDLLMEELRAERANYAVQRNTLSEVENKNKEYMDKLSEASTTIDGLKDIISKLTTDRNTLTLETNKLQSELKLKIDEFESYKATAEAEKKLVKEKAEFECEKKIAALKEEVKSERSKQKKNE